MSENVKNQIDGFMSSTFFVEVIKSPGSNEKTFIVRCPCPDGSVGICSFGTLLDMRNFFDSL